MKIRYYFLKDRAQKVDCTFKNLDTTKKLNEIFQNYLQINFFNIKKKN